MGGFFGRDRGPIAALLLLCGALYGIALGANEFWEPDEPEFALLARTMAERADWIVPWQNGHWYAGKPPLIYWTQLLATGGGAAFRGDAAWAPFLCRLPSALAATALVVGLYLFGRGALGRRAAFLAALALATGNLFLQKARFLQTDMLFTAATAGAVMLFLAADRSPRARPPAALLLAGWGATALAALAKGPLGPLLVGLALAGHLALRPAGSLRRALGTPVHLLGLLLFAAAVLPWYLLVAQRLGPEARPFLEENLWKQNFARTADSWSHDHGPLFYLQTLPVDLLPWTPLLVPALAWAWRRARREGEPFARTALAWFAGGLLFLSCISSKQGKYLMPIFPPLALLLGAWLDQAAARRPEGRAARWSVGGGAAVLLLGGLALALAPLLPVPLLREHPEIALTASPAGILALAGGAVVLVRLLLLADPCRAAADLALVTAVAAIALFVFLLPVADPLKSALPFCAEVHALVPPGADLAQFGSYRSAYPYYLRRTTAQLDWDDLPKGKEERRRLMDDARARLAAFLDRPGRGWVLTQAGFAERYVGPEIRARLLPEPLVRRDVGGKEMVLLREK